VSTLDICDCTIRILEVNCFFILDQLVNQIVELDFAVWSLELEAVEHLLESLVLFDRALKHPQHVMFSRSGLNVPGLKFMFDGLRSIHAKLKVYALPDHDAENIMDRPTTDKKSHQALRSFYISSKSLLKNLVETTAKCD
jgi:hypothetical protein